MGVRGRGSPPKTTTERVRAGSAPPTGTSTESSCHEPMEGSGSNRHGPPNVAPARRRGMVRRSRSTEKETGSIEPKVGSGHLPTAPTTLRAVARRRDAKPPRRHDGIASTVADFGDPPLAGAFGHLDGGVTRFSRPEASAANVPEQQREIVVVFDGHPQRSSLRTPRYAMPQYGGVHVFWIDSSGCRGLAGAGTGPSPGRPFSVPRVSHRSRCIASPPSCCTTP